jgi:hypothetical protein
MVINLADLSSVENLKSYGSFKTVKSLISNNFGFSIKASSWEILYCQLYNIKNTVKKNEKQLYFLVKDQSAIRALGGFNIAKAELSKFVGVKLAANGWNKLFSIFESVVFTFLPSETSNEKKTYTYEEKVKKFEEVKFQNFVNSSKLEGIEVTKSDLTMDELIKKYMEIGKEKNA